MKPDMKATVEGFVSAYDMSYNVRDGWRVLVTELVVDVGCVTERLPFGEGLASGAVATLPA